VEEDTCPKTPGRGRRLNTAARNECKKTAVKDSCRKIVVEDIEDGRRKQVKAKSIVAIRTSTGLDRKFRTGIRIELREKVASSTP